MAKKLAVPAAMSIRIDLPGGGRFGPGKAALLEAINEHGSIAAAASHLNMSYPRALKLVDDMNTRFESPLILARHGGADRGGSALTEVGRQILEAYKEIVADAAAQNNEALVRFSRLVSTNRD